MPGLSYGEQVRRQGDLMHKMMRRLNVDAAFASSVDGGLAWYQARTKCLFCSSAPQCSEWLAASEPPGSSRSFCPNADFFQDCHSEILRCRGRVPTD
jgi:hypothetical protein